MSAFLRKIALKVFYHIHSFLQHTIWSHAGSTLLLPQGKLKHSKSIIEHISVLFFPESWANAKTLGTLPRLTSIIHHPHKVLPTYGCHLMMILLFSRLLYWMAIPCCRCWCSRLPLWCLYYEFKHDCCGDMSSWRPIPHVSTLWDLWLLEAQRHLPLQENRLSLWSPGNSLLCHFHVFLG